MNIAKKLGELVNQQSTQSQPSALGLQIVGLPAFDANYLWVLHNDCNAWAVDPGDAAVVSAYLSAQQLTLTGILVTHHHADHVGGVLALKQAFPQATVIGPMRERIAQLDVDALDGADYVLTGLNRGAGSQSTVDKLHGEPLTVRCIAVPGHTAGHVAYFLPAHPACEHTPRLFCGDTLFAAGCGRLFEGTPAQLHGSLQALASLPAATLAYCAHEYTASNLAFAAAVEPNNPAIQARIAQVAALRQQGQPTVPFLLGQELHSNVFLRCESPEVIASASAHAGLQLADSVDVFAALRAWKNGF